MADKRWCELCGREGPATDRGRVRWYLLDGAEVSLCGVPCASSLKADGLELEVIEVAQ